MNRRLMVAVAGLAFTVVGALAGHAAAQNFRIAFDKAEVPCLPWRVYLVSLTDERPERGSIVTFHARNVEPHFEEGAMFTKMVIGLPGEIVTITSGAVEVGGVEHPGLSAEVLEKLGVGALDLERRYQLGPDEFFMAGTSDNAFDSRYYGPVSGDQLVGHARGLW